MLFSKQKTCLYYSILLNNKLICYEIYPKIYWLLKTWCNIYDQADTVQCINVSTRITSLVAPNDLEAIHKDITSPEGLPISRSRLSRTAQTHPQVKGMSGPNSWSGKNMYLYTSKPVIIKNNMPLLILTWWHDFSHIYLEKTPYGSVG